MGRLDESLCNFIGSHGEERRAFPVRIKKRQREIRQSIHGLKANSQTGLIKTLRWREVAAVLVSIF